MQLVIDHTGRRSRPIIALPWVVGELQAAFMQLLPTSIFTITRDQVRLTARSLDGTLSTDGNFIDRTIEG
jgi:hypothetical protein